jgi:hypothetical protein
LTYRKTAYPASVQPLGSASGYPASGYFAMHITYPDTEYNDPVDDSSGGWEYGQNSKSWRQGLTVIIRTSLATSSAPSETTNVILVDLAAAKTAAASAGSSLTYDLGTEEATRLIAAKINSRRVHQTGAHSVTRYLRARYVRMSGSTSYSGDVIHYPSTSEAVCRFSNPYKNSFPSDLPDRADFSIGGATKEYSILTRVGEDGTFKVTAATGNFTSLRNSGTGAPTSSQTFTITAETPKHTVVVSWEKNSPNAAGGYWAPANAGPIVQGLGAPLPMWKLIAKPMDGGNMGIPALNYDSRSGKTALAHSTNHGYTRFSVEGLNSCSMAEMPPPDHRSTATNYEIITQVTDQTGMMTAASPSASSVGIIAYEAGYGMDGRDTCASDEKIAIDTGYEGTMETSGTMGLRRTYQNGPQVLCCDSTAGGAASLYNASGGTIPRRVFKRGPQNTDRVNGINISNERMVFEDIKVLDDQGNELTLIGGSPLGTVIRDFAIQNTQIDPATGEEVVGPSAPNGRLRPNMQIQLPNPDDIPGEIFVRSGHDRIQAWSNKTWGMGGLSSPDPRESGVVESSGGASQYDTHDRMLIFHTKRILHPDMSKQGLTPHTTAGAVPSGSTRMFAAHRITDHAERGSVLTQSVNGAFSGTTFPHHRIRFGRQGHSFVQPTCLRGQPEYLRRQPHRSHGSAYTLLFEAESEHKHHLFGTGKSSNSSTVFELDTIDTKGETGYGDSTGSFASDGLPGDELTVGARLPNHKRYFSSTTPRSNVDYVIAPGQEHTNVEGSEQKVTQGVIGFDTSINNLSGPTKITLSDALTAGNRFNVASEGIVNGFILSPHQQIGGIPSAVTTFKVDSLTYVSGDERSIITPRVATEIGTIPPLFVHDPEFQNLAAVPLDENNDGTYSAPTNAADRGLITTTSTGGIPDAFLCTWLAEYNHPALLGGVREQFMTFRYREAGMPRATNLPAVNGLLLRNHSNPTTTGQAVNADVFERIFAIQWLQNYGYNALNAGGHGTVIGLRSAGAVLMGHTTVREASGTLRGFQGSSYTLTRTSRGEGIGDGINPEINFTVTTFDTDSDSVVFNQILFPTNSMTCLNLSRRLPVRGFGFRGASDALDMLAGDPTETASQQSIFGKGRFDGGVHDSMQTIPTVSSGADWRQPAGYSGIGRSSPVGFVMSGHTAEATQFFGSTKPNNKPLNDFDEPLGIGRSLEMEEFGLLKHEAMAGGMWGIDGGSVPTDMVLWLKADSLSHLADGASISSWEDVSGNGHVFSQGTSSAKPTFRAADSDFNNQPIVDCDGSDQLIGSYSAQLNPAEFTLFCVAASDTDDNSYQGIIESRSSTPVARSGYNIYAKWSGSDQWSFWHGKDSAWGQLNSNAGELTTNTPDIITAIMSGTNGIGGSGTQKLRINGTQHATSTSVFYASTADGGTIGNVPSTFYLEGQIAEIIMYDRSLTDDEIALVEDYLGRKYAISGPKPIVTSTPQNEGNDPFIDLVQYTGSTDYSQTDSPGAQFAASGAFGSSADFYHLRGNALHTNAAAISTATATSTVVHYPVTGWGTSTRSGSTPTAIAPIPLSEVAERRQVQTRNEPRLGLVIETENERATNQNTEYGVISTSALSLHSDLNVGQRFPVLPSWTINTQFTTRNMTSDGTGAAHVVSDVFGNPQWSPDSNETKGAITVSNDTTRVDAKTNGKHVWSVRGSPDLPPWGGVFILRRTFLDRNEDDNRKTTHVSSTGNASASQPRRKYVDYIVRTVRPLQLYGFASDLMQDGWVLGPRCLSSNSAGLGFQPFTRDKRYGVFEMNESREMGGIEPISAANGALIMDMPDGNDHSEVFHLIPTANMLQFFKSDAHRSSPDVEPRYSQATHPGGGEIIYQSGVSYSNDGTGITGEFARKTDEGKYQQTDAALSLYPTVTVQRDGTPVVVLDDASFLPSSGSLFMTGVSGKVTYTSKSGNTISGVSNGTSVSDLTGKSLYFTDVTSPTGVITEARSRTLPLPVAPSFIDNTINTMKVVSDSWRRYDSGTDTVHKTTLNYRGLLNYDPTDFIMASQSSFTLKDGAGRGIIVPSFGGLLNVQVDGRTVGESFSPPYLIDQNGSYWRISKTDEEENGRSMVFRNIDGESLSNGGISVGPVLAGQRASIGIRTTDAVMHLLNDAAGEFAGFDITPSLSIISNDREVGGEINAHPGLRLMRDHSSKFIARKVRGLNVMEIIRNISQMDGRQLILEDSGGVIFSSNIFNDRGMRIGVDSGARSVNVSRLFDSPNEVIVVGDLNAQNERVFVVVRDLERMREAGGAGATENMIRTLRQEVPGITTKSEAIRIAKSILNRAENGAPMVTIQQMLNATSISPGEIIDVDMSTHGLKGKFAVFEATHSYNDGRSDLVVAQYDKGIEGILSDIQSVTGNSSSTQKPSGESVHVAEVSLSGKVRVVAVHRVAIRSVNNTGFIIGAKHSGGMGQIGVRTGNKRGLPIGNSKSRFYIVK